MTVLCFRAVVLAGLLLPGCGGRNTVPNVTSPGKPTTAKTRTLEAGADLLQDKTPLKQLTMYLDGFHFYNGDMAGQMEAHHYCSALNEDVTQCVIYDSNGEKAKLMGVEYIISAKLFAMLPAEEKKLWHSHVHEVKSGQLLAPGIPLVAEHELMEKLMSTYGKTFHTWHTDQKMSLPLGHPMMMMGFTKDGQVDPKLVSERDNRFGSLTTDRRKNRVDIPAPAVAPGADAWQQGDVVQLELRRSESTSPTTSAHRR